MEFMYMGDVEWVNSFDYEIFKQMRWGVSDAASNTFHRTESRRETTWSEVYHRVICGMHQTDGAESRKGSLWSASHQSPNCNKTWECCGGMHWQVSITTDATMPVVSRD